MKIIHLILGKANPNRMNGVNKVVNSLATYQAKLGYNVSIWGITPSLDKNYPERDYKTVLFPSLKNKLKISQELVDAVNEVDRTTVFHIHGGFIPEFYHFSKMLTRLNIKYVFTPHGAYNIKAMEKNKWVKKIYFVLVEKHIVKNAKSIHCIGQSEKKVMMEKYPSVPVSLIPNGQNIEELEFQKVNLEKGDHLIFGFCGRIDIETKGLDLLLEAFANYNSNNNQKSQLWIIGDDGEMSKLKVLADKLGVIDHIKFWGKRFGQDKLNIMSQMDVFFHPSRNEGLPGAVLEAASLGVSCVVSQESNMAGYIQENQAGVGLIENTIDTIYAAMKDMVKAMELGQLKELGENAKRMVISDFNWNQIAEKHVKVYNS